MTKFNWLPIIYNIAESRMATKVKMGSTSIELLTIIDVKTLSNANYIYLYIVMNI